ncbi:protein kinase [Pseudomonas sp. NPDC087342]|uniref:protein kinase domain-containing protein n=1 Tax=Pseudomonas sp. NPDC087342 TaxID=3364437 RepID=UPI00382F3506
MSATDDLGTWKTKHPGIPEAWKQLGAGGNAYVWFDGLHAIKRLKPECGREAVARFRREAEIVLSLRETAGLSLVPIIEVRTRADGLEIVMDVLDGSLDDVIVKFVGDPRKAALALAPIAETLAALAARGRPIHHRDIKPSNLLFRESDEALLLADFGCAYLAEDERLTPKKRAMGAWAFRPPEYSVGRVTEVNEKGDVFSLGKVFWAMIYGERGIVFPGPVWFEREFDLGLLFPDCPQIHHAMLLISKAAAINAENRPTMAQFADGLRAMATDKPSEAGDINTVELLRAEALIEVEYQQRRASTAAFVRALHTDLHQAISELHLSNPELQLWREWLGEAQRTHQTADALVVQVAEHESDASVVNVLFRRRFLITRFHPATEASPAIFRASLSNEGSPAQTPMLCATSSRQGTTFEIQNLEDLAAEGIYTPLVLKRFLELATRKVLSA